MGNVCLHRGGPLGQGMIEGGKVVKNKSKKKEGRKGKMVRK